MSPQDLPGLRRRLGVVDAVTIGLGSMIGAGIFVALGPSLQPRQAPGFWSDWLSRRSWRTATRHHPRGWPRGTRTRAAPTPTAASGSATSGAIWLAGVSWWAGRVLRRNGIDRRRVHLARAPARRGRCRRGHIDRRQLLRNREKSATLNRIIVAIVLCRSDLRRHHRHLVRKR